MARIAGFKGKGMRSGRLATFMTSIEAFRKRHAMGNWPICCAEEMNEDDAENIAEITLRDSSPKGRSREEPATFRSIWSQARFS